MYLKLSKAFAEHWANFLLFAEQRGATNWVFRGHPDSSFKLVPKIGRLTHYNLRYERALIGKFQRALPAYGLSEKEPWSVLAMAQHHGLPTRILDWTTNPLIAAYFAVSNTGSIKKEGQIVAYKSKAVEYVRPQIGGGPLEIEKIAFFSPNAVSARIVAQDGLFSVHPEPDRPWVLDAASPDYAIFNIPAAAKAYFQRRLFAFGFDDNRIFGGVDGLCRTLDWQYNQKVGLWLDQ